MRKIQYTVYKQETGSAGGKAKNDCYDILLKCGFLPSYRSSDNRTIRIIRQYISILGFRGDDILVVQYPTVSQQLMPSLLRKLEEVKCSIGIIHDIPAFQGMGGKLEEQIDELNHFKFLIAHNNYMIKKLEECGCRSRMVSLDAFDYLHDIDHSVQDHNYDGTIVVAGNLDKSKYLKHINKIKRYRFNLYGIKKVIDFTGIPNAEYLGLLPSNEIQYLLRGSYGLVWDGDSIETCSDIHGEYLKINNPHKMSLYLAAGIPIITWKKAAIADFVIKNGGGVVVDSLEDLNYIDLSKSYSEFKRNAEIIKKRIAAGEYLKRAIREIEAKIY
ncbi:MAG: hypothetical protein K6G88_06915 [Lachnospiraceae bacterium]|nr:hypothetical protein [Lachnospiraceae bacterium]